MPAGSVVASHSRHSRVVGCVPVPNASPGSSVTLIAAASGAVHHEGTIHSVSAIRTGANCACVVRTQSCSATARVSCGGGASPSRAPARASAVAASIAAGKSAVRRAVGHRSLPAVPGSP